MPDTTSMPVLIRNPDGPYNSPGDERAFFEWIARISCIGRFWGSGSALHIEIKKCRISDECLRELLALFSRYDIAMAQLAQFETKSNRKWFRNEAAYWFRPVFGRARAVKNRGSQPNMSTKRRRGRSLA